MCGVFDKSLAANVIAGLFLLTIPSAQFRRYCTSVILIVFIFSCSMLAEKLNMSPQEAERWIVDLIRQAKLDAKIDSQQVSGLVEYHASLSLFFQTHQVYYLCLLTLVLSIA